MIFVLTDPRLAPSQTKAFGDNCSRSLQAAYHSCHPTSSLKAVEGTYELKSLIPRLLMHHVIPEWRDVTSSALALQRQYSICSDKTDRSFWYASPCLWNQHFSPSTSFQSVCLWLDECFFSSTTMKTKIFVDENKLIFVTKTTTTTKIRQFSSTKRKLKLKFKLLTKTMTKIWLFSSTRRKFQSRILA